MKTTTSLCFTQDGLINPESLSYLSDKDISSAILFGDGSEAAFRHMVNFDTTKLLEIVDHIGIGLVPLYDLRVINHDGSISKPQYVYSDDARIKWICSKICTHYINVNLTDITSQSKTSVALDSQQTELVCYLAHRLWSMMLIAETHLCFPAVIIDRMTRWTYSLTPETIDIKLLKKEVGIEALDYNHLTDLLSVTIAGDIFSVKLSVLNSFYGDHILPLFNKILGRRVHIQASVAGTLGKFSDPVDMSYGELGRIVEDMRSLAKEQMIDAENPIPASDLLVFAKKAKISDETCIWPKSYQSLSEFLNDSHDILVRECSTNNIPDQNHSNE